MFALRGSLALAALGAFASTARAFVLIDDFTVGEYHGQIVWPDNGDIGEVQGLDRAHCALGNRRSELTVQNNFDRVPLAIDVGGGTARVSYGSHSMSSVLRIVLFGLSGVTMDLSAESRIFCEVRTEDPRFRFADQWSITVFDDIGGEAGNGGWRGAGEDIYFEKSDLSGSLDWSRIRYFSFTQEFEEGFGDVPLAYSANRIYAVPEPGSLAALALLAMGGVKGRRKHRP